MEPVAGRAGSVVVWVKLVEELGPRYVDLLAGNEELAQKLVLHLQDAGVECGWRGFRTHICMLCGAPIKCNCPPGGDK